MLKTKTWIIIFAVFAAVCGGFAYATLNRSAEGTVVEVIQDDVVVEEINLSAVKEPYSFTVEAEDGGYNVVSVEPGRIRVSDADCPDRVCVHHQWLVNQSAPIVCIPHKLMIRFSGEDDIDAVAQ